MIPNIHLIKSIGTIAVLFFLMSCAAIQAPPGGPKDETPPELIETIPANGTVLFEGGRVELIFSEYVDENTINNAIRVLPTLDPAPEIIYKGRRLFINMPDSLDINQTYIILELYIFTFKACAIYQKVVQIVREIQNQI